MFFQLSPLSTIGSVSRPCKHLHLAGWFTHRLSLALCAGEDWWAPASLFPKSLSACCSSRQNSNKASPPTWRLSKYHKTQNVRLTAAISVAHRHRSFPDLATRGKSRLTEKSSIGFCAITVPLFLLPICPIITVWKPRVCRQVKKRIDRREFRAQLICQIQLFSVGARARTANYDAG